MKKVLIEGWRGINHSYAIVNQNQLLQLRKSHFDLYHNDLPFYNHEWNIGSNASGFADQDLMLINEIPSFHINSTPVDVTYRISFPYRFYKANSRKLFVFGTSEYQSINGLIYEDDLNRGLENSDLMIITPSNWSKEGFLIAGFRDERVYVVPHGVSEIFKPVDSHRKSEFRKALGCSADEFLLLSVGAMTGNKGIDLLIAAYALLKRKYKHIRLILKDSSNLYGIKAKEIFIELQKQHPELLSQEIYKSIIFISENLTQSQLNGLYGTCDCYVSPYRAEGFNLSPLEAAASGSLVLVTEGGSTDDYFHSSFGLKIEGKRASNGADGFYIEPNMESLLNQLTSVIEGKVDAKNSDEAQKYIRENFSWDAVVQKLINIFDA
ncbi:glycosyltransferase family 4 protein [Polynucleobacter sp. MWH-UH23A]|uniref:glycosyltransferase family 4 protein n=1 Tax=Polynucleobacter sp. MWH-UH23A TaxID=1855613 RepID=UPI0033650D67